jgi:ribonucleoside-diphosphate reductase beta chain
MSAADRHLIERLVAFFATGDSIVANNLVISLYRHINAPEARMYLSRQLYEEALHIQFYLTLLDNYVPDQERRAQAFAAIENIASIRRKAEFCQRWTEQISSLGSLRTQADKRLFLLNLTCFAACIESLFFFGAFSMCTSCARAACCPASRPVPPGCFATKARTWPSPSRCSPRCVARSRSCSMPSGLGR